MSQGAGSSCLTCGGFIPEPDINYSYGGKICYCPIDPSKIRYQKRADEQGQSVFVGLATNQTSIINEERIKKLEQEVSQLRTLGFCSPVEFMELQDKVEDYEEVLMKLADYKGGDNAIKEAVDVLTKYGFYET